MKSKKRMSIEAIQQVIGVLGKQVRTNTHEIEIRAYRINELIEEQKVAKKKRQVLNNAIHSLRVQIDDHESSS